MPDKPRPNRAIAFPAFQTPGGLLPQAVREHHNDYAETQGHTQELARRTDGVWLDLPYSPGRYTTTGAPLWVVEKKNAIVARYKVIGATCTLNFNIVGTLTVAPTIALRIHLPERFVVRQAAVANGWGNSAGVQTTTLMYASVAAKWIDLYRTDFAINNWNLGTAQVTGQIAIEVEEA